jgi:para-aminobenzoate synthetase component I
MRTFQTFKMPTDGYDPFIHWAKHNFKQVAFLSSSNLNKDPWSKIDAILATGVYQQISPEQNSFEKLKEFTDLNKDWIFGFLSYDLKNQIEKLDSKNQDGIKMPLMHFFVPEILFIFRNKSVEIGMISSYKSHPNPEELLKEIIDFSIPAIKPGNIDIKHRVSRSDYINLVNRIKNHIQHGDIYEMNYCIEFFAENAYIDPAEIFLQLNQNNPAPFSCFYRIDDKYLISSSPERYLAKRGKTLISQPIKGTIKRGNTPEEDQQLVNQLLNDPKERSENVMIVDLVRNDLARTAQTGTVRVKELFGIYSYTFVHQMISTVTSILREDVHFVDAIKKTFPMGSMTGAPKIRAMQIIEECEATRRGLYSGAVGYITPNQDFDFNVIIRSILYNESDHFLNFMAGSAITIGSDPEKEYNECLLKAASMAKTLKTNL